MTNSGWHARAGAFAFMVGVSWAGLQAAGAASADTGQAHSPSASGSTARHSTSTSQSVATSQRKPQATVRARTPKATGVATSRRVPTRSVAVATAAPPTRSAVSASANPIQDFADHVSLVIRRTFFNKAPTVNPIQITGQHEGVITGTIGAVDPEGDVIKYKLVPAGRTYDDNGQPIDRGPLYGTVEIAADGTFTYTPGEGFTGSDSFAVLATDVGLHINLLDLFRAPSTRAAVEVDQYAIGTPLVRFSFNYGPDSDWWTPAARAALQAAADRLAALIVREGPRPVTITYSITVENAPDSNQLGTGGSPKMYTPGGAVFVDTVVQHKILTGVDQNGTDLDGQIWFNSSRAWSFDDTPGPSEFDFQSVALHELVHTLGFSSTFGSETSYGVRSTLDGYLVDSTGAKVFDSQGNWVKGGYVYFDGPNAVAAYGEPVPMYVDGSHLDSFEITGKVMNPATPPGVRRVNLSAIEIGILKDLGYTIAV